MLGLTRLSKYRRFYQISFIGAFVLMLNSCAPDPLFMMGDPFASMNIVNSGASSIHSDELDTSYVGSERREKVSTAPAQTSKCGRSNSSSFVEPPSRGKNDDLEKRLDDHERNLIDLEERERAHQAEVEELEREDRAREREERRRDRERERELEHDREKERREEQRKQEFLERNKVELQNALKKKFGK